MQIDHMMLVAYVKTENVVLFSKQLSNLLSNKNWHKK